MLFAYLVLLNLSSSFILRANIYFLQEDKENTKAENNRLKTEINRLNEECVRKNHALKSREEENKHLQQKVGRLEGNLNTQNIVVEVFTKQLVSFPLFHFLI